MNKPMIIMRQFCFAFICLLLVQQSAFAEQTIFNVPSADVTPKGMLFLQHESQTRPWRHNAFWYGTQYGAYGIGHNTEIDATLYNFGAPHTDNITLGVGFKTAQPILKKAFPNQDFKITFGEEIPISLQGQGVGNWTYGHFSGRLPKLKTRLTAGVSYGTHQIFGRNVVSFIGGYEQPITKRFSLIGDWYSGTHGMGLFTTGFSYALTKSTSVYVGYQIPNNTASGYSGIVFELSKLF